MDDTTYSIDLRERAVAAVESGRSRRQVAKLFKVGESSVIRWCARQRVSGTCAAKPMGGHRRPILLTERDWLLARLSVAPDLTIRGLLSEPAIAVSKSAMARCGLSWQPRD